MSPMTYLCAARKLGITAVITDVCPDGHAHVLRLEDGTSSAIVTGSLGALARHALRWAISQRRMRDEDALSASAEPDEGAR